MAASRRMILSAMVPSRPISWRRRVFSISDTGSVQPAAIARMACSNLELPSTNEATIRNQEEVLLVPAASVKGAISHRTAFYYNGKNDVFSDLNSEDAVKPFSKAV